MGLVASSILVGRLDSQRKLMDAKSREHATPYNIYDFPNA